MKAATAGGDETALGRFFTDAREILEQEHAQWLIFSPEDDVVVG